jgi:hypothetical protein
MGVTAVPCACVCKPIRFVILSGVVSVEMQSVPMSAFDHDSGYDPFGAGLGV